MSYAYVLPDGTKGVATSWNEVPKRTLLVSSDIPDEKAASALARLRAPRPDEPVIFVDGCFDKTTGRAGSGAIVFADGVGQRTPTDGLALMCTEEPYVKHWQVGGECIAAVFAMRWAKRHDLTSLTIVYDYVGIPAWSLGLWNVKPGHVPMQIMADEASDCPFDINYYHVYSHDKDPSQLAWLRRGNDLADALAKKGVGLV